MAARGVTRLIHKYGLRTPRVILHGNGAVETPFHITPQTAAPTVTKVEGDIYWVDSNDAPTYYDGSAEQVIPGLARENTWTGSQVFSSTIGYRRPLTSLTAAGPTALAATDSGTQYCFNRAAGVAVTLPAVTASEVGVFYDFYFETTATGDHTITAQAADLLIGGVNIQDFDTANTGTYFAADGSDDLIITMNGTTKGGKKGSWLRLTCSSATSWIVQGYLYGDGTLATPFS